MNRKPDNHRRTDVVSYHELLRLRSVLKYRAQQIWAPTLFLVERHNARAESMTVDHHTRPAMSDRREMTPSSSTLCPSVRSFARVAVTVGCSPHNRTPLLS